MKDAALIPLRLFKNRTFSLVIVAGVIVGVAMFGGITLIPQYLQIVKGSSPTVSGLQTLPLMVGLMGASLGSGQITARTGRYKIFPIIGSLFIVAGSLLFTQLHYDSPLWQPMIYMFVLGMGVGLCMQTLNLAAQNAAPAKDMGVSTSSATFFRQIGGTLGVAVFLSILFSTVGNKIVTAITNSFHTPAFVAALHNPALVNDPVNGPIIHGLTSGQGVGGALTDASFISQDRPGARRAVQDRLHQLHRPGLLGRGRGRRARLPGRPVHQGDSAAHPVGYAVHDGGCGGRRRSRGRRGGAGDRADRRHAARQRQARAGRGRGLQHHAVAGRAR